MQEFARSRDCARAFMNEFRRDFCEIREATTRDSPRAFRYCIKKFTVYYLYIHVEMYTYVKMLKNTCFFSKKGSGVKRREIVPLYIIIHFHGLARTSRWN